MIALRAAAAVGGLLVAFAVPTAGAAEPKVATTDEFLEGELYVDRRVHLPQGGASARVHLSMSLTNTGPEPLKLVAPSPCAVHNYHIVLPNNDLVAAKTDCDAEGPETTTVIAAGETIRASNSLTIDRSQFEEGRRYFVVYEFWGVRMRAPFEITFETN